MEFYIKIYRAQGEVMVAACDKELYGKIIEEGDLILRVDKKFYGGERVGENKVQAFLAEATIANLIGENVVQLAIREGIIDAANVLRVKGVPHAQMARI